MDVIPRTENGNEMTEPALPTCARTKPHVRTSSVSAELVHMARGAMRASPHTEAALAPFEKNTATQLA